MDIENIRDVITPILCEIKSNLFYAEVEGGHIYPSMISRKKSFCPIFLHTHRTTKNRVTHQKAGLYLNKSPRCEVGVALGR